MITKQQLKPRPLGAGSLGKLLELGDLQNARHGDAVPVDELIDRQSRLEWGYLHALGDRLLIGIQAGESVALTRGGWAIYRRHRS